MKRGHLPQRAEGPADQREEEVLTWWWWRGIMCGEAGCLHRGFTSATSHPLFETIISCSIIQMIFTRANYTGLCPAEKMARVFYCCTYIQKKSAAEAVQARRGGLFPLKSSCLLYFSILNQLVFPNSYICSKTLHSVTKTDDAQQHKRQRGSSEAAQS